MTPARPADPAVMVCVITYRRPDELDSLLPALLDQARTASGGGPAVDVLVVDNDPDAGASAVVGRHAGPGLRGVHEPRPGIAAARNRALDEARDGDAALLVFIDDDERPAAGWLRALLDTWSRTRADAVVGPVVSEFEHEPDAWVRAGGFFARRHRDGMTTGDRVDNAATNNLLLDLGAVQRLGLRFDPGFGLSGGSDTLFTRTFVARGGRLVWCQEAVVTERVPASRLSRRWLLTRAISYGTTDARVAVRLARGWQGRLSARVTCVGGGLARIVLGSVRYVLGRATGSLRRQAVGQQTLLRGCGLVAGVFGYSYQRYRRPAVTATGGRAARRRRGSG